MDRIVSVRLLGPRRVALLVIAAVGVCAAVHLELTPAGLIPGPGGRAVAARFFGAAIAPAVTYQDAFVPAGTPPLLINEVRPSSRWKR